MSTEARSTCPCGCACCGPDIPIRADEARRIIAFSGRPFDDLFHYHKQTGALQIRGQRVPATAPRTIERRCGLLDPATMLCTVYRARPDICVRFPQ